MPNEKQVILSGMRPTGQLHLGHLFGVLQNWVDFQKDYQCFYMVADWHAMMSEYAQPSKIRESSLDNVAEWLAWGIDPETSVVFLQSDVPEHLELYMLLSFLTPIPWLSRCPTFKEQQKELADKDINTHAFLGYPVLQTADIILYRANAVPVGQDQLPHLELCREIVRRYHHIYKCEIFPEPQPILTEVPKILGLDRRKMSKSYQNFIALSDDDDTIRKKVKTMITDEERIRLTDPGHPDICNVFSYYNLIASEGRVAEVRNWCEKAELGCTDCKGHLADHLIDFLAPKRAEKERLMADKGYLKSVLKSGAEKARERAQQTMKDVKQQTGFGSCQF